MALTLGTSAVFRSSCSGWGWPGRAEQQAGHVGAGCSDRESLGQVLFLHLGPQSWGTSWAFPPPPPVPAEHLGHSAGALGLAPTPDRMLQPLVAEPPTGSSLPLSLGWPWGWPSVSSGCEVAITSSFRETEFEGKSKCLAQLQRRGPSQRPPAHSIKKSTFSINSGDSPSPPGEDEGMWRGPPRLPCSVHTAAQRPWSDSFATFSSPGHTALQSLSVPSISWSPGRRGCAWAGAGLPPPEG